MSLNKQKPQEKFLDWIFLLSPTFIGLLLGYGSVDCLDVRLKSDFVVACLSSAIAGYGFTATALIITLPRTDNKFLKYLDSKKGRIFGISLTLCLPSITSVLTLVGYSLNTPCLKSVWDICFIIVIIQFLWSIVILFAIIRKAHN